ncbi:hypothetical protein C8Q76DRAFT_803363 [Earliella scabrosa]|nr:hypothetical protein C8Q76DRAFT_803363 [Earliella scabrosa]
MDTTDAFQPLLEDTYGVLLIATFVSLLLYGITLHQSFRYFRTYTKDTLVLRCLVVIVLALETFHTVLLAHLSYHYLVTNYFKFLELARGTWSLNLLPCVSGLVICASQLFFVRRVFITIDELIFIFAGLGFNTAGTVTVYKHNDSVLPHLSDLAWIEAAATGSLAIGDTMLTIVLVYALRQGRSGWKKTDSMIDTLVLYSITTGLLTGVMNLFSFILSLVYPSNLYWSGFGIVATRLYANTLLAAANLTKRGVHTFGTTGYSTEFPSMQVMPPSNALKSENWEPSTTEGAPDSTSAFHIAMKPIPQQYRATASHV